MDFIDQLLEHLNEVFVPLLSVLILNLKIEQGSNMEFQKIAHLTQANADQIARKWHYSDTYKFYDMENDSEDFEEIITPKLRGEKYYQVLDDKDELVGYFCLERLSEEKVEVGLGLRPDLTGRGLGLNFVTEIEAFIQNNFNYRILVLSVASFNKRAIKVYQRAGFKTDGSKLQKSNDGVYEFINLSKTLNRYQESKEFPEI